MPAHADFLCERCHDAGKMAAPIELPVDAKRCPLCGKAKWLSRIWGGYSPLIATDAGKAGIAANEMLGGAGYDHQRNRASDARMATRRAPHFLAPQVVGVGGLGAAMSRITQGTGAALSPVALKDGAGKPAGYDYRSGSGHGFTRALGAPVASTAISAREDAPA